MHAYILIAPESQLSPAAMAARWQRHWPEDPDVIVIQPTDKLSIGIEDVRNAQAQLSTSPLSEQGRLIIITPGSALSLPAQQALLKMVEEPPPQTQIVLATSSLHVFLPTMQSRCEIISVNNKFRDSFGIQFGGEGRGDIETSAGEQLPPVLSSPREKVVWAQQLPNKKAELESWLTASLTQLLQAGGVGDSLENRLQQLQALNSALLMVRHNVTPMLVNYRLALSLAEKH